MSSNPSLRDLFARWHEQRKAGRSITAEELCHEFPAIFSDPTERHEAVQFMEGFLDLASRSWTPVEAPSASGGNRRQEGEATPVSEAVGGRAPVTRVVTALAREGPGGLPTLPAPSEYRKEDGSRFLSESGPPGFDILGKLGEGGMGVVYQARQTALNRVVALKMIRGQSRPDSQQLARFHREAESVARLQHPNIVQVFETGEHEGQPYFAMEFVPGGSLQQKIAGTPQPVREAARLVLTLALAMQHAHDQDVIHRDLKPANILLLSGGVVSGKEEHGTQPTTHHSPLTAHQPKITDFGLAKQLDDASGQTHTGAIMGTPSYMAPEQAEGKIKHIGPWTDVWALGAILYEMLTGRPPFKGEGMWDTLEQVRKEDPVPVRRLQPRCPRDLETICLKCLRKAPLARYPSARELAVDLERFLDNRAIKARPAGVGKRLAKWARRRPALAALAVVLILSAAGVAGLLAWHTADLSNKLQEKTTELLATQQESQREKDRADLAEGETQLQKGVEAARAGEWDRARTIFAEVAGKAGKRSELKNLREHAHKLLDELDQVRGGREEFDRHSASAMTDLARVISGDQTVDRKQALAAGWKALAVFGITVEGQGGPVLDPAFFSKPARERITTNCYELLLFLAIAEARPAEGKPSADELKQALKVLDRAGRMGLTSRAYHERRALLLASLDLPNEKDQNAAKGIPASSVTDFFLAGHDLLARGHLEEAEKSFTRALDRRRDHLWARYFLAQCHLRLATENPERAYKYWLGAKEGFDACIAQNPDVVWAYILNGYVRNELGDVEGSENDFKEAERRAGQDRLVRYAVLMNRGTARTRRKDFKAAEQDLLAAIKVDPKLYEAHVNLARLYEAQKKGERALEEYREAIRLQPGSPVPYRLRARLHIELKKPIPALKDLDQAIQLAGNQGGPEVARDHVERANLLEHLNRLEEAEKACRQAMAAAPGLAATYALHGRILLALDRFQDAFLSLTVYIDLSRRDPRGAPPRAEVYRARGFVQLRPTAIERRLKDKDQEKARIARQQRALADLSRSLELEPNTEILVQRGWLYLETEAPLLAQTDFAQAIKENPRHAEAYTGRGFSRAIRGDVPGCVVDAEKALALGPQTWRLTYNAARVFAVASVKIKWTAETDFQRVNAQSTEFQRRAVELLRRALALHPSPGDFWTKVILPDAALNPLRSTDAFKELKRLGK
jgi:eukaryotic-like serine/threonine-protein kinase